MGAEVPVGINRVDVWVDTPVENWTHVLLYVRSPLFEMTTPFVQTISDTYLTVDTMEFLDQDLDVDELGGYITFARTDETLLTHYVLYWTELPNMTDEDTGSRRLSYDMEEEAEVRRLAATTSSVTT
ncbi:Uncharacterized protein SCF082_LOCUS42202, partial [Durusdinium trenchii]